MASLIIHYCIASELLKKLTADSNRFLVGAIAPNVPHSNIESKRQTHFWKKTVMEYYTLITLIFLKIIILAFIRRFGIETTIYSSCVSFRSKANVTLAFLDFYTTQFTNL